MLENQHEEKPGEKSSSETPSSKAEQGHAPSVMSGTSSTLSGENDEQGHGEEGRPIERRAPGRSSARGTAAMDPETRQEVARKGGLAVSRNRQHMSEIGRKGGQSVSKNREHMANIGRKGGAASRGHGHGHGHGQSSSG
jgi:general stress protein YciG